MLSTIWGEIVLGWHRATRGPLMIALIAIALLTLLVLPGKSDPTLIYTGYGLGLFWATLLFTSLWCGGTSYALDRERHRLALTFTKPIYRLTLWFGKWLAVWLPFCCAILIASGLTLFRALPNGRSVHKPLLPDLNQASKVELERLRQEGRVPENIAESRLLRAVYEDLEARYIELRTKEPQTYQFPLPKDLPIHAPATFRLAGRPFLGARDALQIAVTISCAQEPSIRLTPTDLRDTGLLLDLPSQFLIPGETLKLTLERLDEHDAASIIFKPYFDCELLLPGIPAWQNLIAFTVILLLTVGVTSALGVSLGALFSLPVTLFTGVLALLACCTSILAPTVSAIDSASSWWATCATIISETLANPFASLAELNPLHRLLVGEMLSPSLIVKCFAQQFLPAVLLCSHGSLLSSVKDEDR